MKRKLRNNEVSFIESMDDFNSAEAFPQTIPTIDGRNISKRQSMLAVRGVLLYLVLIVICGAHSMARADAPKPVLISQPDSTRAIALEAITFTREPFSLTPPSRFHDPDPRTRILLFALNLSLQPGEDLSAVTADAEDIAHRHYSLKVEFARDVPGEVWMKQVTLRLND